VLPTLTEAQHAIARDTLPSTSAAHASLPFVEKAARWSVVFGDVAVKTVGARVIAHAVDYRSNAP
jgi:hypothetical protein